MAAESVAFSVLFTQGNDFDAMASRLVFEKRKRRRLPPRLRSVAVKAAGDFASVNGNVGVIFEGMKKSDLFPAVVKDGALPRKTFSMGEAKDKRFYLEARVIN